MNDNLINNGLIILDKPGGHTSHEISAYVKAICGSRRSGHAGTLDPNVSGVLPIALGRATKLLQYIAGEDKTYVGLIKFRNIQTKDDIESYFERFSGEIIQTPPKMSAVRRRPRKRIVHYFNLLEISPENPRLALFEAKVGAGTYIRTLCSEVGALCGGARMEELRRTAVGKINENQSHKMDELIDAMWLWKNKKDSSMLERIIVPAQKYIFFPKVIVKDSVIDSIRSGAQIMVPGVLEIEKSAERGEHVAIYSEGKQFLGIGIAQINWHDLEEKKRGIAFKLERVHI
jgi:predicted rRNA pseudouridine synthase